MTGPIEADDDFNLTVIRTDNSVLIGRKTRGFGEGRLVLPGGKTRYYIGDSGMALVPFQEEAARELSEETGLSITTEQLAQKGILHIADADDTRTIRVYEATVEAMSQATSTELADLGWHSLAELRYLDMPEDYALWLPHILGGYAINGFIETDANKVVAANIFRQKLEPLGRMEHVPVNLPL